MSKSYKKGHFKGYLLFGIIFAYAGHWLVKLFQMAPKAISEVDIFGLSRFNWMWEHFGDKPWLDLSPNFYSLLGAGVGFLIPVIRYLMRNEQLDTYRPGEEHGTARYATTAEINSMTDEEPDNNMILSQNVRVGLFNKRLPYDKQLNKNMALIGSPGEGKTRNMFKPNIMQLNSSFMMTDPKGLTVHETGHLLVENGFKIKVFDLITFSNSDGFNVFQYMNSELDIDRVANSLVEGTRVSDNKGEDFWGQAENFFLRSLLAYLYIDGKVLGNYMPNLGMLVDLLRCVATDDPEIKSPVQLMFEELEKNLPGNYANRQFDLFLANMKERTYDSVRGIVASRFSVFDHDEIRNIVSRDTMEIETWQIEKTGVFIAIPETDKSYNFLANLFFTTVFKVAPKVADEILQGKHPKYKSKDLLHLRLYLDEFANLGKLPNFPESQSSGRSREISYTFAVQAKSQAETIYGKTVADTIFNNSAALVYLGTNDPDTMKYLSRRAGTQTLKTKNYSQTYSQQGSSSQSVQSLGRSLLTEDEIGRIPIDETLVYLSKQFIYRDKKFDLATHKYYGQIAESPGDDNWYVYQRYMTDIDEWYANVEGVQIQDLTPQDLPELPWVSQERRKNA